MKNLNKDWSTKLLLIAAVGLLSLNLLVMSGVTNNRVANAAGIPDSGAQLQSIVDEAKGLSQKMDTLQKYLESGALTVKVKKADEDSK